MWSDKWNRVKYTDGPNWHKTRGERALNIIHLVWRLSGYCLSYWGKGLTDQWCEFWWQRQSILGHKREVRDSSFLFVLSLFWVGQLHCWICSQHDYSKQKRTGQLVLLVILVSENWKILHYALSRVSWISSATVMVRFIYNVYLTFFRLWSRAKRSYISWCLNLNLQMQQKLSSYLQSQ